MLDVELHGTPALPWNEFAAAAQLANTLVRKLAGDRELLGQLVARWQHTPSLLACSVNESHVDRLLLHCDDTRGFALELESWHGLDRREVHENERSSSAFVLRGQVSHTWYRRDVDRDARHWTKLYATVEREGACFSLQRGQPHAMTHTRGSVLLRIAERAEPRTGRPLDAGSALACRERLLSLGVLTPASPARRSA